MTIFEERAGYSRERLAELVKRVGEATEGMSLTNMAIFSAGSFARLEASPNSDLDVFFAYHGAAAPSDSRRTNELRLFGEIIRIADALEFPAFSNDCQYLQAHESNSILQYLGSAQDDAENYFTLRMLLLLESRCVFGQSSYDAILRDMVGSYYRDFPGHADEFRPWFLINDILRFWKTLLLNYEHKRNPVPGSVPDQTAQRVRNFKLKFSRMTTCFATVAAIVSHPQQVGEGDVIALAALTPRERLLRVADNLPATADLVAEALGAYAWFLEQTALTKDELHTRVADEVVRTEMMQRAKDYGEKIFSILAAIDETQAASKERLMRYLVI